LFEQILSLFLENSRENQPEEHVDGKLAQRLDKPRHRKTTNFLGKTG
jgi:hypothetical protein